MTWTTRQRFNLTDAIASVRVGDGDPVALIHGVGLCAESWGAQIDPLASEFSIYALDMPGHGRSQPLPGSPDLSDYVDRIAEALSVIGKPVRIAGHSMGALIAIEIAIRYPSLCNGVAALNTIYRRSDQARKAIRARAQSLSLTQPSDPTATLERWFGSDTSHDAATACRAWLTAVDPAAYGAAYRVFAEADGPSDEGLKGLTCPALFLTGEEEPNSTPAMTTALAAHAPNARAEIISDAAHMVLMTHPDDVTKILSDFFHQCKES